MSGRIIFLLEEASMATLLEHWLPRLFPGWISGQHFLCVPHHGKSDLDKSIPRKLRAWGVPDDHFVIVRDNDNADCIALKRHFLGLCDDNGRPKTLIRLVCQELESWYLGDLAALADAFKQSKVDTPKLRKRFDNPDALQKPSTQLARLVPEFQKISGARKLAQYLHPNNNQSSSLRIFVAGVRDLGTQMGLP